MESSELKKDTSKIEPVTGSIFSQKIRVPLGFMFAVVFLVFSQPQPIYIITGLFIAFCGLFLRLWSAGHLRKHRQLTISGPYCFTRNPLYLGSFLMGIGFSVASAVFWMPVLFLVLFLAVYIPVMKREEAELIQAYGQKYREYLEEVPIFFPALRSVSKPTETDFLFQQLIDNKEYNSVIGFIFIAGILFIKLIWL